MREMISSVAAQTAKSKDACCVLEKRLKEFHMLLSESRVWSCYGPCLRETAEKKGNMDMCRQTITIVRKILWFLRSTNTQMRQIPTSNHSCLVFARSC
jgi:hypothetical protein